MSRYLLYIILLNGLILSFATRSMAYSPGDEYVYFSDESVHLTGFYGAGNDGGYAEGYGDDGGTGQNGQSIMICAQTVVLSGYFDLTGGSGANGMDGQDAAETGSTFGGNAGNGGDGGHGGVLIVNCTNLILDNFSIDVSGGRGGDGGFGGMCASHTNPCLLAPDGVNGFGGNGGDGGSISLNFDTCSGTGSGYATGGNGGNGGDGRFYHIGIPTRGGNAGVKGGAGSVDSQLTDLTGSASNGTPGMGGSDFDCDYQTPIDAADGGYRQRGNIVARPGFNCQLGPLHCYDPLNIGCSSFVSATSLRQDWGCCGYEPQEKCPPTQYNGSYFTSSRPFHYTISQGAAEFQTISSSEHYAGDAFPSGSVTHSQQVGWQHISSYVSHTNNAYLIGFTEYVASYETYMSSGLIGGSSCAEAATATITSSFCGYAPFILTDQPSVPNQPNKRYSRWYKLSGSAMDVSVTSGNVWVNVYHGTCGNLQYIETLDTSSKRLNYPGETCYVEIASDQFKDEYSLSFYSQYPTNDERAHATPISCGYDITAEAITTYATPSSDTLPPSCQTANDVWYKITVPHDPQSQWVGRYLKIKFADDPYYGIPSGSGGVHNGFVAIYSDWFGSTLVDYRNGRNWYDFDLGPLPVGPDQTFYIRLGSNSPSPLQSFSVSCFNKLP